MDETLGFLDRVRDAIDLSIVDFYKLDAWTNIIPASWKTEELTSLSVTDLIGLPSTVLGSPTPSRRHEEFFTCIWMHSMAERFAYAQYGLSSVRAKNEKKGDKKRHEVDELSARIGEICHTSRIQRVFDFGAGQGYLSQILASEPWSLEVTALERDDGQCHGSIERSSWIPKVTVRQLNITRDTDYREIYDGNTRSCFCSLHACGSLSCHMLRMFVRNPAAISLVNVGCCYNLIEEEDFPMSRGLSKGLEAFPDLKRVLKDRTAKMLACQSAWRWHKEPVSTERSFRANHYRAMLEIVLAGLGIGTESRRLGGFPTSALKSFDAYCRVAFKRLELPYDEALVDEVRTVYDTDVNFRRLSLVWTMRALLGAVLEALIMKDRKAFLEENLPDENAWVGCVPVFDPMLSPRNIAIMAGK
jgi:hypothetical protein